MIVLRRDGGGIGGLLEGVVLPTAFREESADGVMVVLAGAWDAELDWWVPVVEGERGRRVLVASHCGWFGGVWLDGPLVDVREDGRVASYVPAGGCATLSVPRGAVTAGEGISIAEALRTESVVLGQRTARCLSAQLAAFVAGSALRVAREASVCARNRQTSAASDKTPTSAASDTTRNASALVHNNLTSRPSGVTHLPAIEISVAARDFLPPAAVALALLRRGMPERVMTLRGDVMPTTWPAAWRRLCENLGIAMAGPDLKAEALRRSMPSLAGFVDHELPADIAPTPLASLAALIPPTALAQLTTHLNTASPLLPKGVTAYPAE